MALSVAARARAAAEPSLEFLAAVGTFVFAAVSGVVHGTAVVWNIIGGVACLAVTAVLAVRKRRAVARLEKDAGQVQVDLFLTLNRALAPLTRHLADLAGKPRNQRRQLFGQLVQAVVSGASELIGPDQVRACYYELNATGNALNRIAYYGRGTEPRLHFDTSNAQGRHVLDLVREFRFELVPDVTTAPGVSISPNAGYRTFIAVAVAAGSSPRGLLTVDAPAEGCLSHQDLDLTKILANVLGAAAALI